MEERLKILRKHFSKTQAEFAESIGLSRIMVAQVETGKERFSDRTIRDICRIYDINEEWLRNGTGEMKKPKTRNQQIAEFINEAMSDSDESFRNTLIYGLTNLDYEDWLDIERVLNKLANKKEDN